MNRIKLNGTSLTIGAANITIPKAALETLRSFSTMESFTSVTLETDEYAVFLGPYIDREETGFIFQAINKLSRKIESVRIPFGDTTLSDIKEYIGTITD